VRKRSQLKTNGRRPVLKEKDIFMPTITEVYDSHWRARNVVSDLEAAGIPSSKISMIASKKSADAIGDSQTQTGAGVGAVVGGGAGLLASLGLLAIPGLGPILTAGWLVPTTAGALAGGVTGGIVGALVDSGVSEEHAHVLSEAIRRGGTLVSVRIDEAQAAEVRLILDHYDPVDPDRLGKDYRKTGWNRFDPNAEPYELSEAEIERRSGLR
jgi:uncharacterized membrane protein